MDNLVIAGKKIVLEAVPAEIRKKLWLGLLAEHDLYVFEWEGQQLLLLAGKQNYRPTPVQCKNISDRLIKTLGIDAVFYYENMPTYERDRLVDKGIYFIIGSKFTYIPNLLANRKLSEVDYTETFLPSTQYLLLYHLQIKSLEGATLKELVEILPYKYATIAKSVQQLAATRLLQQTTDKQTKRISFNRANRKLWIDALKYMANPIKHSGYSGHVIGIGKIGGIEALSHYSMLAGEETPTKVLMVAESKKIGTPPSLIEDIQRVEIWKYPPVSNDQYVDKLSLYLTLRDDNDPRVEKELETMINEMSW